MAHYSPIFHVSDKLIVGAIDTGFISGTSKLTPGTAVLNGPVFMGLAVGAPIARATCTIGPPYPSVSAPLSLQVDGLANITGSFSVEGSSTFFGVSSFLGAVTMSSVEIKNGIDLKNGLNIGNALTCSNSPVIVHGPLQVSGPVTGAVFNGFATGNKPIGAFDIPHVRKKGKRIRHLCVEAPAADIYIRGTLVGSNTIDLPEYWDGLVDTTTITVDLTPIECYQELYVDKIEWGKKVIIKNNAGGKINCHYQIWASRWINPMDHTEQLHVVYDGESPDDYPGNKSSFLVGGWDYDRRNPNWK